jgi:hypothetical protein
MIRKLAREAIIFMLLAPFFVIPAIWSFGGNGVEALLGLPSGLFLWLFTVR